MSHQVLPYTDTSCSSEVSAYKRVDSPCNMHSFLYMPLWSSANFQQSQVEGRFLEPVRRTPANTCDDGE